MKPPPVGPVWPWVVLCTLLALAMLVFASLWYVCVTTPPDPPSQPIVGCGSPPGWQARSFSNAGLPGRASMVASMTLPFPGVPQSVNGWMKQKGKRYPQGMQPESASLLEAATKLAIAEADGSPFAGYIHDGIALTPAERDVAPDWFREQSERDGMLGFMRLGLTFLGQDAFDIAAESPLTRRLYVPFCPDSPTDFVGPPSVTSSYMYFSIIERSCADVAGKPDAQAWMDAIRRKYARLGIVLDSWEKYSIVYLEWLMQRQGLEPDDFNARRKFCIGAAPSEDGTSSNPECQDATKSRQALKYGDAAEAQDDRDRARSCWRKAIDLATKPGLDGKPVDPDGAPAAILAQKRLQTNETTCKWSQDSLAAISRDYKARSGDLIHVRVLQQSLKALGHYDGKIDGDLSPPTRAAIRKFQREIEEDETDALAPEQIVKLVCHAAENARDVTSQTTLGIMYATGLGVDQDMDKAHYWLTTASNQHFADATFDLSILYGTGIILDSYRLCDVPHSPEQADKYLQEAAAQGQPIAVALWQRYGTGSVYASLSPRERWALIELQQLEKSAADKTGLYAHRIATIGTKCAPDRNTR